MRNRVENMNRREHAQNLVFAVVPLLLFVFMLFRLAEISCFYQCWYDPTYAYLFNGLTFALGSCDIGHIDHPGTPLQLVCALLIKITGLVRGTNNLATDVLTHPELYLKVVAVSFCLFNSVALWLVGTFAFRSLKNYNTAIAIQLFPLLSFELVKFLPIVACETVVTLSSFVVAACIILYMHDGPERKKLFAAIVVFSALSVATKISTVCILFIPFFFFEGRKLKLKYVIMTLLLMIIFVSPIMGKIGHFLEFIKAIFTHTGSYGAGEEKLIDWGLFFLSLKKMATKEWPFTLHLIGLAAGWYMIGKRKIEGPMKRLYVGITVATIFQVLVVARNYSFHYLIPVFALTFTLHGYFWVYQTNRWTKTLDKQTLLWITAFLVVGTFARLTIKNGFEKGLVNPIGHTSKFIERNIHGNFIILPEGNCGMALDEPALRFGLGYTGKSMKKRYASVLTDHCPGNCLWSPHGGLTGWNGSILAYDLFSEQPETYIYAANGSCENSIHEINRMVNEMGLTDMTELSTLYENKKTAEAIVLVKADTARVSSLCKPAIIISTDMETETADGKKAPNQNLFSFTGTENRSGLLARGGKFSTLLSAQKPYGLTLKMPVSQGRRFRAEFWQQSHTGNGQAYMVASASKGERFYQTSGNIDKHPNEWVRSELTATLPADYPEDSLTFYIWYTGTDSVWVDDLKLEVYR